MKNRFYISSSENNINRLINIVLRGVTLVSKFLLIIFFAKYLAPQDFGMYGLFAATVAYGIYLIGFEFYTYSMRVLISANHQDKSAIIKNQFIFYIFSYVIFTPLFLAVFFYEIIPWLYLLWIVLIITLEHLSQELNRILIAFSDQLFASIILFIRSGVWCIVVITVQYFDSNYRNLTFVFLMWGICCFVACLFALRRISRHCNLFSHDKIDIEWIISSARIAIPMLIASMAIRGIFTFDKYIIENLNGLEILGIYVFFIGMATAVLSFIDAGVVDFAYPKLITLAALEDKSNFLIDMRKFKRDIILIGTFLILACALTGHLLTIYIGKPSYLEKFYILYWLLAMVAINILSLIPHLGLYALGQNRHIIFSQVTGLIVFLATTYALKDIFFFDSVLIALCMAWFTILVWKSCAYKVFISKLTINSANS